MCGRYFFQLEEAYAFQKLRKKIQQQALFEYAKEEVFPSQNALVLKAGGEDYTLDIMHWGIDGIHHKLLINARSEGILEKRTFQIMLKNRCLVPCNGFFEWVSVGKQKQKLYIHRKDSPLFYLAGIYNEKKEFVIVTGEAEGQMKDIHSRVPIILKEEQIPSYLQEGLEFMADSESLCFDDVDRKQYIDEQLSIFSWKEGEEK